ncbi:MAG TPA: PKD domain-containing protein, partial [Baekduia sp.]
VPLSGAGVGNRPVLAIAPDGSVAVAWVEGAALEVSVRGVTGAFSAPSTIPTGTGPTELSIAAGPASDILLAWTDTNGAQGRVMTAYRPAGGPHFATPVSAVSIGPGSGMSLYLQATQVAFDPAGEASLIWLRTVVDSGANTTDTRWEGRWRTAGPAGAFAGLFPHDFEIRTLNTTLPTALDTGTLAADASGRTSFVWPALAAGGGLDMATRTTGGGFGATQTVQPSGVPRLDAAAAGSSLMVVDGKVPAVAVAPAGGTLGAFDATPFHAVGTGAIAVVAGDAAGDAATLWASKDGTVFSLRTTAYDATPPEARALAVPATATAGAAATFSVTPWDALTAASATWDFGDGTTATGASVQHAYATAGDRTVTVTVADQGGNTTTATRSISVAPPVASGGPFAPVPGPGPAPAPKVPAAPALTGVKLTRTSFAVGPAATPLTGKAHAAASKKTARGTVVQWRLSAAATVRLTVATVPARGKRSRVIGTLRRTAKAAASRLAFSGRVGKRALAVGSYKLTLTATDAGGRTSKPVTVRFRVLRAR